MTKRSDQEIALGRRPARVGQIGQLAVPAIDAIQHELRAARHKAVTGDIVANVDNPALSLDWIARRHGVSPRHLRALFYDEHTSFTDFVLAARLERAYRMLTDPAMRKHRISAIAFKAGFGDLSWFNEAFRRRYSMTPSDVRAFAGQTHDAG